jgi:site-specific recombinase XerD
MLQPAKLSRGWAGMFETLFHYPRVLARHVSGPLAEERRRYLDHRAAQGTPRSTLLRYATELLVVASSLELQPRHPVRPGQIQRAARRWARRQRRRGRANVLHWSERQFVQVATAWLKFLGWLVPKPRPGLPFEARLQRWAGALQDRESLSPRTIAKYRWWAQQFLRRRERSSVPLRNLSVVEADAFLRHLSDRGLSRASLATAAKSLRRFFHYAYEQGWCRRDIAEAILAPRRFRQEDVPQGPAWADVQRLLASTHTDQPGDIRNRAILWLFAVYGLRSGEVAHLRLSDLDWPRQILRVRRSKSNQVDEYPLTQAASQVLRRYVREVRPAGAREELFLSLPAPFRPLSNGALYDLVQRRFRRLDIRSPQHGPHSLRHACATYLLNRGLTLKQVGDHLGHRHLGSTQVYAKVDLAGLREVADFDLGGLV